GSPQPVGNRARSKRGITSMKWKCVSFVSLLAVCAFAAIPTTSQAACTAPACPHVYENGVKAAGGKKVRLIEWGTLTWQHPGSPPVHGCECHHVLAGYLENPTDGGPAVGKVQAFSPYECTSPSCIARGGKGVDFLALKMPWRAEVVEPETGVFRQRTGFK